MVGMTTTWGTVLDDYSIKKVEIHTIEHGRLINNGRQWLLNPSIVQYPTIQQGGGELHKAWSMIHS